MSSRKLTHLSPATRVLAEVFLRECRNDRWLRENNIKVLVTCTHRPNAEQARLYAKGRTKQQLIDAGLPDLEPRRGKRVTNARPGESRHNLAEPDGTPASEALDIVPLRDGKCVWGTKGNGIDDDPLDDADDDLEVWQRIGEIGVNCGLEWAGNWTRFREFPHFQLPRSQR